MELPTWLKIQIYVGAAMIVLGFGCLALNVLGGTLMMIGGIVVLHGAVRAGRRLGGR